MRRIFMNVKFLLVVLGLTSFLSACNSQFVEGDPYYYELVEISASAPDEGINNMYIIDPFEEKVIAFSSGVDNMDDLPYTLEQYDETDEELAISYENNQSDRFEKKSDSLWESLDTEAEYSVNKIDGEFDYTKVKRP